MTRREEREQAFILIFEKSFNADIEISELFKIAIDDEIISDSVFVKNLAFKTWENLETIDALIQKNTKGWKIGRISKVSLAILRMAVCEMLLFEDIPVGVSINEAVELCKKYAAKEDASFVNGLLGAVSKEEIKC